MSRSATSWKNSMKIYVGGLPFNATEDVVREMFTAYGNVESAQVIMDRDTGRSKGFAFVEMSSPSEASASISQFNGTQMDGRAINVSEAKPQAPRDDRRRF